MTLQASASARPAGIAQALRRLVLRATGWALFRTGRFLASRALQVQARRFDQVLSNLQGAILLVGVEGKVEYVNSTYCDYFSIGRAPDALIGTRATQLLRIATQSYADPQGGLAHAREMIARGATALNEEVALKNGRVVTRDSIAIEIDGQGQGRLWFYRDMTDILRLHETNRESRDRYQAVVDASMDGIVSVDEDHRIVVFNAAAEKMFLIPAAEAIGQRLEQFIPMQHRAPHAAHMREFAQSGVAERKMGEFSHVNAIKSDGTAFPIAASISHVLIEGREVFTATLRDISRQEQTEAALKDSEERYRTIVEWSPVPARIHRDGVVIYVNPAAVRLFGAASAEELVGKSKFDQLHPDSLALAQERIARTTDAHFDAPPVVLKYVRKDGKVIHTEVQGRTISYGGQLAVLASIHDITSRTEAEAVRASLETQLRETQKMVAIGTLAGGIAHEFNNILATILGNVQLAREDAGTEPNVLASLDEISKAGARARDLVQQILSFSRRQPVERTPIDLANVVEETARLLRATLPARVSLEVACAPATPAVLANAAQLEQVLISLATNAMQAIGEASGTIGLRLDSVRVDAAEKVRLTVTDTGPGMDAAVRARIFEPFFTTKAVNEGTGLGLSAVHGIVHLHEGSIEVESAPRRGATFTILLPAACAEAGAAGPGAAGPGRQILYIDDDQALVSLFKRLLERRGYRVSAYTDQHEALAALRADPAAFDLVVTDYNMPGLSGLDVARAVRAIRPDLPVAVASGFVDEALVGQAAEAGVREVLFKATSVDEYCTAVQCLLDQAGGASR
ncbi:MAG: PAS domain S-box protein [Betaproteobacteria bacterium]